MKRDDTKKNFTALSGNDLATVHLHYLSFSCFIALVTFSEICGVMRYRSVINALFHFFCSENRNFFRKKRYPACRRIPLFIYLYRSRNQQRGLICLKKSLPLLSTKINAGKFSTSIFQIASIPNSGYSTHSMLLILF